MNWFKQLFSRRRLYNDLSEEIQEHIKEKIEELVASASARKDAAAATRREFGNLTLVHEDSREVWRWRSIENFLMDVRFGLRMLRKNPGFTAVAVLTLALGIGANTAMFSLVDGVLLKPLPFPESDRLVSLFENQREQGQDFMQLTAPGFVDWRTQSTVFEDLAAYQPGGFDLTGTGDPAHLSGIRA